jgi:hypothetical protein
MEEEARIRDIQRCSHTAICKNLKDLRKELT